jgi:hypothetical protein
MSLRKHTEKKTDNYSKGSRDKLKAAMRHKIKRTFVGALDAVEKELLSSGNASDKERFKRIRSKVLSIGNDQIRNMEVEMDKYNIEFIPYHIDIPCIPLKDIRETQNNEDEGI